MTGRARAGAAALARRVPKPVLRGIARLARRGAAVSVVVVVTDDNAFFLDECVDSLGRQVRRADEIVLVVTGTTPFAGELARRQAGASHRVRVVPAAGLAVAEARNCGVAAATGDYLLVHDGGDLVGTDALAALAGTLDRTGGRLAVGGQPRAAERVDVQEAPEVLQTLGLGSRMFRRDAWDPTSYDVPAPLHHWLPGVRSVLGTAGELPRFDTVTDPVCRGLGRGTGLAFGAMRRLAGETFVLDDAVREVLAALSKVGADAAGDAFVAWLLAEELPRYLDDAERCDAGQWQVLCSLARELVLRSGDGLLEVPVEARVKAWLASEGRREELAAFTVARWQQEGQFPTEVVGGRLLAVLGVEVPDRVREVGPAESGLHVVVRRASRSEDGELDLELLTVVQGLGAHGGTATASVEVVGAAGERVRAAVEPVADPEANVIAAEPFQDHTGRSFRVTCPEPPDGLLGLDVEVTVAGIGRRATIGGLTVRTAATQGTRVDGVELDGLDLLVRGSGPAPAELVVHHPRGALRAPALPADAGFEARVRLEHDPWRLGPTPLTPGLLRIELPMGAPLVAATPLVRCTPTYRMRVRRAEDGTVLVDLGPPLADDEVGAFAQQRLQEEYAVASPEIDPGFAYFQSYTGQATDSPLAIHQAMRRLRPGLRSVWAVADRSVPVPAGAEPVLFRSREWYAALATAGHVVTNIDLDPWFVKRPGQRVLQTYHGHPSKAMGLMAWEGKGFTPLRVEEMLRRTARAWDLLVAPSPAAERLYREQFGYTGEVVSAGYPRNDELVADDREERRVASRGRLGIAPTQRAVLYAPTWRDDLASNHRVAPMAALFDVGAAAATLGDDHVLLLRGHRFHRRRATPGGARILDVTEHPRINDLILAADAAVLDYSSLRFDIALAGRPMVFLVPDLERYAGRVRGFLHDFAATAPGPLVDTTDEVVEQLRDLDRLAAAYRPARERFIAEVWAEQDDRSADRVVTAFWPEPGTAVGSMTRR